MSLDLGKESGGLIGITAKILGGPTMNMIRKSKWYSLVIVDYLTWLLWSTWKEKIKGYLLYILDYLIVTHFDYCDEQNDINWLFICIFLIIWLDYCVETKRKSNLY